ncbi:glycosyltransferase [candidate division KSB1 bacterium]|nr:glycosyltransferase [candidate division KSB1 bacterium]
MNNSFDMITIDDYLPLIGKERIDRIKEKASLLKNFHIVHVNSTYYGGGVAQLLSSVTNLTNSLGIDTGWRVLQGSPDFFGVTKKMHNALQGDEINLTARKIKIFEQVIYQNALRNHLDHDAVIIHDPQPLPMILHYRKKGPWIWRCHIDLSQRDKELWEYLIHFVERYDAMVISSEDYRQQLKTPQRIIMPAIDPFSITNMDLSENQIAERLKHYEIPTDLPLVVQISRFDPWKDPHGVIQAFKKARKEIDATLVLLGEVATDDPEGPKVYQSILDQQEERIIILSKADTALVNALQRKASVILQKSLREGFGLTVSEAMWKGTPVIGGNVGGIRHQITDGENGFLVDSVDQAAERIVQLLTDKNMAKEMGEKGREIVREKFLLSRYIEDYIDLFNGFETNFKLKNHID